MINIRHLGPALDDIDKDFDAAALVRTHSRGSDAHSPLPCDQHCGPDWRWR
jgi:hypothetical protein